MPSIVSRLLFLWVTPFIHKNAERNLTEEDLLQLADKYRAQPEFEVFSKLLDDPKWQKRPLFYLLLYRNRKELFFTIALTIPFLFFTLGSPFFLRALIQTLEGKLAFEFIGQRALAVVCAIALSFCCLATTFAIHHIFYRQLMLAHRVRAALSTAVYRKALSLSRDALQRVGSGFVVNLIAVDIHKIFSLWMMLHALWWQPILIVGVLVLLYHLMGGVAFYGVGTMIVMLLCGAVSTHFQSRLRRQTIKINDRRVGLTNEVISNIRGVKIASKEEPLSNRILELRGEEVARNKKITLLLNFSMFTASSAPVLAMGAMFMPIIWAGGELSPAEVFPVLALLHTLRFALMVLPDLMLQLVENQISLRRLRDFFDESEFSPRAVGTRTNGSIALSGAEFEWQAGERAFSVASLKIEPGELVAVIGEVGSGKSAFLLSLLNELKRTAGEVEVAGATVFVAQQPWLVSETIRKNIIGELPFDAELYQRALELSQFEEDLKSFPGGDYVEIGERGITLSGGQRQRLALARAYYHHADIVLLDDPLSALDPAVANRVYQDLILGAWGSTTRVLVTHRLEYALKAARVLVIENGAIVADGKPEQIVNSNAIGSQLISAHREASFRRETAELPEPQAEIKIDEIVEDGDRLIQKAFVIEDREVGAVGKEIVRQYFSLLTPGLLLVTMLLVFTARQIFGASVDLWWTYVSSSGEKISSRMIEIFFALSLAVCVLNFVRSFFVLRRGLVAGKDIHQQLISGVLRAPLRFFESNPVGRILNRFSRDLETVDSFLPRCVFDLLVCWFDGLTTLIILIVLQPTSIIVLVPIFWVYFRWQERFRPTSREGQRLDSVTRSPIFALLSESLRGVDTIRAFSIVPSFFRRFMQALDTNGNAYFSLVAANRWLALRLESLGSMVIFVAAISAALLPTDIAGAAFAGFVLTYAMGITSSMNWFVRMVVQTESNLTSFERIQYYARQKSEAWEGAQPRESWPEAGDLQFKQLSIRYREELPLVLKDFDLSVNAGERIGIVGRTGSGKSTMTQALFRLLEADSGSILIDGIDIATIPLRRLRESLTMIPQEPVLFSGTIRSNLDPYGRFNDQRLYDVLKRVELYGFVCSLPHALDASVIEGGHNFSAGQRQLLCLAQALLKKNKLLILDEATAHVDPKCDLAIHSAIRREFAHATQLIIAHRLGTVIDCDRIVVMEQGKIIEVGAPRELLANPRSGLSIALEEIE